MTTTPNKKLKLAKMSYTVQQEILTKGKFDEFDEFLVTSIKL